MHELDELHAAASRHGQVQHQHLELQLAHALHDLRAVGRLVDHFQVFGEAHDALESFTHDGVVVGDDDAYVHAPCPAWPTGMRARTCVPAPSAPLPGVLSIPTVP